MSNKKVLPPTFFNVSVLVIILLHFFLPIVQVIDFPWKLVGIIPAVLGIILNVLADRAFKRNDTTVKPYEESTALITDGVFRLSRNPMYLGMGHILLGINLFSGSLSPIIVISVFVVMIDRVFIRVEESMLEKQFGHQWTDYKKSVRRWI